MKEDLKPCAYKQSEGGEWGLWPLLCLTACLLKNEPASYGLQRG